MTEDLGFSQLLERVRAGDGEAAATLVRRYEPAIRRAVRIRMADPRLRRLFDSIDVCQSVMGSFFVRTALGEYEIETPEQLLALLSRMARNKLTDYVRRQVAGRRDIRRRDSADPELIAAETGSPSEQVAHEELLAHFRRHLSPEELLLARWRSEGVDWADIGERLGERPDAARKRLSRAIDRVARQLGIEEY